MSWFLVLASGSEAYTAAGAAEHSLQRNDQVSDTAPQSGAGMISYSGLAVLQLLSHPIKSRFSTLQMERDWPSNPETRGREGSPTQPDINISWARYTRCWEMFTQNQISSTQVNQRDIGRVFRQFHDSKPFNLSTLCYKYKMKHDCAVALKQFRTTNSNFIYLCFFVYYIFVNLQRSVIGQLNVGFV